MSIPIPSESGGKPRRKAISLLRLLPAFCVALLPSLLKVPIYRRLYGYSIGCGVRIGFGTLFYDVGRCRIGDHVRIGAFNGFIQIGELEIGAHTQTGVGNLFRGGDRIRVGDYVTIMRLNVFNSIIEPDAANELHPELELGVGVVVTTSHWIDFSDRVTIGAHAILGGRSSSLWTHNRQRTRGIAIGPHCYLGSEIRLAPGVELPAFCIVAIGAVILSSGTFTERSLIAGNPATTLRPLRERDLALVARKTRRDIPDEVALAFLPVDLRAAAGSPSTSETADETAYENTDESPVDA